MSKKIKSEKIYSLAVAPGEQEQLNMEDALLQSVHEYDPLGNLILEITFNSDGSVNGRNEFVHDDQGNMTGMVIYGEEEEALETRRIYRDERGQIEKEEIIYLDGSVDTVTYMYEDGILKEKVQKNEDEEVEARETYEYEEGKVLQYQRYDEEGEVVYRQENRFDNGVLRESRIWVMEDGETYRQAVTYNGEGRRTEELKYDRKDRLIERNRYEEDETGKVVRVVEENTSRKNTTELKYDQQGRLLEQVETDLHGQIIHRVEREYDDQGVLKSARVNYLNRMTGSLGENFMWYEYEFYD